MKERKCENCGKELMIIHASSYRFKWVEQLGKKKKSRYFCCENCINEYKDKRDVRKYKKRGED